MLAATWWTNFCVKVYFTLAFVENINHFDSQFSETVERRFLYIYRHLYSHLYEPMSQVLHPTYPNITNFRNVGRVKSHIQAVRYQIVPHSRQSTYFLFVWEPTCLPYLFLIFSNLFPCFPVTEFCILDNFGVSLRLSTFRIIFPTFWQTAISPDFIWIFIDWVSVSFFPVYFSPWPKR